MEPVPAAPVLWPAGVLAGSCVCCGTRACRPPEAPAGHQPGRHRACLWRCSRQGEFSGRRGSTPRLPAAASKKATIWAPRRRRGRGHRAGMPPSLDLARSAPCPHDPTRPSDAAARSDSAEDPESAQHPSQQVGSRGRKSTDFQQLAPLQKMSPGTNMVAIATTQHTAAHPDPLTPSGTSLTEGMAFSVGIGARQQVLLSTTILDPRSARRSAYTSACCLHSCR